jgi:hypothetical protein
MIEEIRKRTNQDCIPAHCPTRACASSVCARAFRSSAAPPTQHRKAAASARCCCGDNAASEKAGAEDADEDEDDEDEDEEEDKDEADAFLERLEDDDDDDSKFSVDCDASATSRRSIKPTLCIDPVSFSSEAAAGADGCTPVDRNTERQLSTKARHHASAAAAF